MSALADKPFFPELVSMSVQVDASTSGGLTTAKVAHGATLREMAAMMALQGLLAHGHYIDRPDRAAELARMHAGALMAEMTR